MGLERDERRSWRVPTSRYTYIPTYLPPQYIHRTPSIVTHNNIPVRSHYYAHFLIIGCFEQKVSPTRRRCARDDDNN